MKKWIFTALFFANAAAIALFWWQGSSGLLVHPYDGSALIAFGRLAGLLTEFFILIELILISRISLIEKTYGFDVLNQLHRWIGYGLLGGIIFHPLMIAGGYASANGVSLTAQFFDFFLHWENVALAAIGLIVLVIVAIISLPIIRKKLKYETWHVTHLLMYVAIGLALGHQMENGDVSRHAAFYYWFALNFSVFGGLLAYRFIAPLIRFYQHRFVVEKIVQETPNVYSVYITGRNMDHFKFDPGQYIHASFLMRGLWQPHPFSLSKAANGAHIRISIKALGDYTKRIQDLQPGISVIIEGPFGRFTEHTARHDKYLLIAGGIGITPIRALVESLSHKQKDVILLYGNRTPTDLVFKNELEKMAMKYHYVLSETVSPEFESGHIDEAKIARLVPDIRERDIYVCGPKAMMDAILAIAKKLNIPHSQIHYEKFSY